MKPPHRPVAPPHAVSSDVDELRRPTPSGHRHAGRPPTGVVARDQSSLESRPPSRLVRIRRELDRLEAELEAIRWEADGRL